jgi:hypothetical protein
MSVRIKFESEREGENKSQANKNGWHGDLFYRGSVLANLLPIEVVTKTGSLSTLSLQSNGTLSPLQGPPQLGVSCFDYKRVGNKNRGKRKAIQAQELKRTQKSLSLVTNLFGVILDFGRGFDLFVCVLEWSLELLYEVWWLKTWIHW